MGDLVTRTFPYDSGRGVTAYVPPEPADPLVLAADGQIVMPWCADLVPAGVHTTLVVGIDRSPDETQRLHECSPGFDPATFKAHEAFLLDDVRRWVETELGVASAAERTAFLGVSAGAELALAMGVRHPEIFGVVLAASPGGGYRPPSPMPARLPRTYLVAGRQEPFFLDNATRWATALHEAGADVVLREREGTHGGAFWWQELPAMIRWAFVG